MTNSPPPAKRSASVCATTSSIWPSDHPERLQQFIALHYLSIKALAVHDDDFYRLFIDWLPFETTLGEMTLGEYRKENSVLRYVTHLDQFRQIARVAAAQDLCILNGAYTYNAELLEKFTEVFPDEPVEEVDPAGLMQSFEDLTLDEREQMFSLIKAADMVLQPFKCAAEIKKFLPNELPALYSTNADAGFLRSVEQSREICDELWSSVLDNLAGKHASEVYAQLCFNYNNPLIRKMAQLRDRTLLQRSHSDALCAGAPAGPSSAQRARDGPVERRFAGPDRVGPQRPGTR